MSQQNKHLVCFLGRNGSGKTFSANKLVEEQGYTKISMADAMRELLWGILGWEPTGSKTDGGKYFVDSYTCEYINFKESKICMYLPKESNTDENGFLVLTDETHLGTGRKLLQNIGEHSKKMFGQDFWVKQWEKRVLDSALAITSDDYSLNRNKELLNRNYKVLHQTEDRGKIIPHIQSKSQTLIEKSSEGVKTILDDNNISIEEYNNVLTTFIGLNLITTDDIRFPIEIESAYKLGATFIWCDYQNGKYSIDEHPSEALANKILASGKYKHGEEIPFEELKTFFE